MTPLKYWKPYGFEISSYDYKIIDRVNKSYKTSGSDNTGKCLYTYNQLGFRGDSINKEGFRIMSIGCSNTEGVGVNDNETWPHQFSKLIPNGVDLNFGTAGRSNDYISRCLLTYYDLIKPDLVLIMYTSPQRREIYTKDGGVEPFIPTLTWGYFKNTDEGISTQSMLFKLQNDNEDFINWYKNHMLIKYFLESKKCNWLWNGWFGIPVDFKETNRFDGEYGMPYIDLGVDGVHPGPKQNETYATKLYETISENFPHYIYDPLKNKQNLI
jgi:lysophospholipase L1-like esterase